MNRGWKASVRILVLAIAASAAGLTPLLGQTLMEQARTYFAPLPKVMDSKENTVTPEKAKLGKTLFYETRISVDRTVSCSKCHKIALYGTDGLKKAIGNHYKTNPRNAPTVFNAAAQISEHWIGNRTSVEDQAKQALVGPPSYGLASYADAEKFLRSVPGYQTLFAEAFPNDKEPVTADNFAKAIGAWERTLVTPSPFDDYLNGDTTKLDAAQKAGLAMFMGVGCARCHNGPYVGGEMYEKFGIKQPYWNLTHSPEIDSGRFVVTRSDADMFVFKIPVLRNVAMTSPYFHDGSVDSLSNAVKIMAQVQLGVTLDESQAGLIVAFLKSLTGQIPQDALEVPILPRED